MRTMMLRAARVSRKSLYAISGAAPTKAPPTNITTASGGPALAGGRSTQQSFTFFQSRRPPGCSVLKLEMIRPSTCWNTSGVSVGRLAPLLLGVSARARMTRGLTAACAGSVDGHRCGQPASFDQD